MLTIAVVDRTGESRSRIVDELTLLLESRIRELEILPRISLTPLSPEEVKYQPAPDVCIIGEGIVGAEMTGIGALRKLLPTTPLLVRLPAPGGNLVLVEQLARLGADDVLPAGASAEEFLQRVVMLARRGGRKTGGCLILVDSGKGGTGVTTITAGLGEALGAAGRRVALLDFDTETQDLSRFLQARPFINENLQLLFDQQRPVNEEFVGQCLVPVWEGESGVVCMPPVAEHDALHDSSAGCARVLISVLEILDATHDAVIVDAGCARGAMLKTLYRVADRIVFLINNDPAALYASVDRLNSCRHLIAPNARLMLLENASLRGSLPPGLLRDEVGRAARLPETAWGTRPIPLCRQGARWPGSGGSIFSQGREPVGAALATLVELLGFGEAPREPSLVASVVARIRAGLQRSGEPAPEEDESAPGALPTALPAATRPVSLGLPEPAELFGGPKSRESAATTASLGDLQQVTRPPPGRGARPDNDPARLVSEVVVS